MAKFNERKPVPNLDIYDFEGQFESAFSECIAAQNLRDAAKQQDDKILESPFFQVQFSSINQEQRSYMVPGTVDPSVIDPVTKNPLNIPWAYPNLFSGTMDASVITNRKRAEQKLEATHNKMRGLLRWVLQNHDIELSARMKYLQIVQLIQKGSRVSFDPKLDWDMTTISSAIVFTILPTAFPTPD